MEILIPVTAAEAVRMKEKTGGTFLAGGTVCMVEMHRGKQIAGPMIALEGIGEMKKISLDGDTLSIGALVTMDELENSVPVKRYAYALWQAAYELGGPQIRNRATLGGNLAAASPSADCATPLLAMGAVLRILGAEGERMLPLREFFKGRFETELEPEELILSVEIPVAGITASAFRKVGKRTAMSVSCINMSVVRKNGTLEVAVGAAAPKPVYCEKTSAVLSGNKDDITLAGETVLTEISPIDDRWATASYRRMVCVNLLKALLAETE